MKIKGNTNQALKDLGILGGLQCRYNTSQIPIFVHEASTMSKNVFPQKRVIENEIFAVQCLNLVGIIDTQELDRSDNFCAQQHAQGI